MQTNESGLDRIIRALAGLLILYLAYAVFSGVLQILGYVVGLILILTAITGFCLLYKLLGFSTKKIKLIAGFIL